MNILDLENSENALESAENALESAMEHFNAAFAAFKCATDNARESPRKGDYSVVVPFLRIAADQARKELVKCTGQVLYSRAAVEIYRAFEERD